MKLYDLVDTATETKVQLRGDHDRCYYHHHQYVVNNSCEFDPTNYLSLSQNDEQFLGVGFDQSSVVSTEPHHLQPTSS